MNIYNKGCINELFEKAVDCFNGVCFSSSTFVAVFLFIRDKEFNLSFEELDLKEQSKADWYKTLLEKVERRKGVGFCIYDCTTCEDITSQWANEFMGE